MDNICINLLESIINSYVSFCLITFYSTYTSYFISVLCSFRCILTLTISRTRTYDQTSPNDATSLPHRHLLATHSVPSPPARHTLCPIATCSPHTLSHRHLFATHSVLSLPTQHIVTSRKDSLLGLLNTEDQGTTKLRNVGKCLNNDKE